ncbi:hypothetical protein H6504_01675 [Candidatus Woesearchaeota archaeon]|nr:hypothetical protein [Candidatus Woesearchaeota archaeon]
MELLTTELVFFLIVTALCLYIYIRTKEIYELSGHKGLFFFRNTFLFFAIAFFFRLLHILIIFSKDFFGIMLRGEVHMVSLLVVGYASTVALFSLTATILARDIPWSKVQTDIAMQLIALVVIIGVFITGSYNIILLLNMIMILVMLIALFITHKKKILSVNRITYLLLIAFWLVTMMAFTPGRLDLTTKLVLYALTAAIFISIFIRVNKRLTVHGKKKGQA